MPTYTYNNRTSALEPGEYSAEVINASLETSKKGNEMIVLTVLVNGTTEVTDYLVFSQKTFWKIDEFLTATGLAPALGQEIDVTPRLCMGAMARVKIIHEEGSDGRMYPRIDGWLAPKEQPAANNANIEEAF